LKVTSTIFSSYIQVVELKFFNSFWMMKFYKFLGAIMNSIFEL
jgi:hypothetical protein